MIIQWGKIYNSLIIWSCWSFQWNLWSIGTMMNSLFWNTAMDETWNKSFMHCRAYLKGIMQIWCLFKSWLSSGAGVLETDFSLRRLLCWILTAGFIWSNSLLPWVSPGSGPASFQLCCKTLGVTFEWQAYNPKCFKVEVCMLASAEILAMGWTKGCSLGCSREIKTTHLGKHLSNGEVSCVSTCCWW